MHLLFCCLFGNLSTSLNLDLPFLPVVDGVYFLILLAPLVELLEVASGQGRVHLLGLLGN